MFIFEGLTTISIGSVIASLFSRKSITSLVAVAVRHTNGLSPHKLRMDRSLAYAGRNGCRLLLVFGSYPLEKKQSFHIIFIIFSINNEYQLTISQKSHRVSKNNTIPFFHDMCFIYEHTAYSFLYAVDYFTPYGTREN